MQPSPFHFLLILLLGCSASATHAQELAPSASLEELLNVFITQTASPLDSINRSAFRPRLAGTLARTSPVRFKGAVYHDARMTIDSLLHLPSENGIIRVAAWVTVESWEGAENIYFTCICDSIWKIEGMARFPTLAQRRQIEESIRTFDAHSDYDRILRDDLLRLLLPDHILAELLRDHLAAASTVAGRLAKSGQWSSFILRDFDFSKIDEYRELDDDITPQELTMYRLSRPAVQELREKVGIQKIERDSTHPGVLLFVGGSLGKSSYGYLHATTPLALPNISGQNYVMLQPVAPQWWLYKCLGG
ncbi:MAG: hypothetical protein JNJ94_08805 [Chlorobi bacterium]|nr:hypothetical protein [Chlorobiota bacterium]